MKLLLHLKNDRHMYRIICIMICLTSYSLVRGKNGIGASIPLYCATNNSLSIIIDSITKTRNVFREYMFYLFRNRIMTFI